MRIRWIGMAFALVLLGGCSSKGEPISDPRPGSSVGGVVDSRFGAGPSASKAEPTRSVFGASSPTQPGMTDEFGLPLIIVIKPPEVPKEILGPTPMEKGRSTPTKTAPKTSPKKPGPVAPKWPAQGSANQ